MGTSSNLTYLDEDFEVTWTYYYIVTAYNRIGTSARSNTIIVKERTPPVIHEDLVFVAPSDSYELYALNTESGVSARIPAARQQQFVRNIGSAGEALLKLIEELLDIHGFGGKTLSKVEDRLAELGYALKSEGEVKDET